MAQYQQAAQAAQRVQQANRQKQQQFDAAVALIKQDGLRGFRIDIEADSTIAPDEPAEKQARVEFMEQFVPFMQQIVPRPQGNPAGASMAKEITLFVMRGLPCCTGARRNCDKALRHVGQDAVAPTKRPGRPG